MALVSLAAIGHASPWNVHQQDDWTVVEDFCRGWKHCLSSMASISMSATAMGTSCPFGYGLVPIHMARHTLEFRPSETCGTFFAVASLRATADWTRDLHTMHLRNQSFRLVFLTRTQERGAVDFPKRRSHLHDMKHRVVIEPDEDAVYVADARAAGLHLSRQNSRRELWLTSRTP